MGIGRPIAVVSIALLFWWLGLGMGQATEYLYDGDNGTLTVAGFLRSQWAVRTSPKNPSNFAVQDEKNDLNLARNWLLADLEYEAPMAKWFGPDAASLF